MTMIFPQYGAGPVRHAPVPSEERTPLKRPLRRARREDGKLLRRIERAEAAGDHHKARGLQALRLRSFSGRLVAVADVNHKLKKGAIRARTDEIVAIAARLDVFSPIGEEVKVYAKPKAGVDWRPVTVFGLQRSAAQLMALNAIRPFHTCDPRQLAISGGGQKAAARQIKDCMREGYVWFASLDISGFYSNIERSRLNEIIPINQRVIDHVINPPPPQTIRIEDVGRALSGSSLAQASQTGISQGARTSPLVAEIVLRQVLATFPEDVRIINVADDFAIMARTKREAIALSSSLTRAVARSRAGRFTLRTKAAHEVRSVYHGFEFVGYYFRLARRSPYALRLQPRRVICQPSEQNETKFNTRVLRFVEAIEGGAIDKIPQLRKYVRQWWRSFPEADNHAPEQFYRACQHVLGVIMQHHPTAVPLVLEALHWEGDRFAQLLTAGELDQMARRCRGLLHRSNVPHW